MTHLVTGGAGFIGSHLSRTLLETGRVVVLDDLSGGWADNVPVDAELITGNVLDVDLDWLFQTFQITHVWHLAAYAAEGLSHWVREHNVRNNWLASTRLINAAVRSGVEHFYFTSSMAVYGDQTPPYSETLAPKPIDPYGTAKWAVEQDLAQAGRMFGLPYTIFRPHNVYGPNQNIGDPYRNVVGIFMRKALSGEPLTVFGDGLQTRAFSYITDITGPMVTALTRPTNGLTFNIGGEHPVTILDLASHVSALFGGVPIVHTEERYEARHAWCDHTRARNMLGFQPRVGLIEGLEAMARWAESVSVRWSTTPQLEHRQGLPAFWESYASHSR